jgi:hypothetical protein
MEENYMAGQFASRNRYTLAQIKLVPPGNLKILWKRDFVVLQYFYTLISSSLSPPSTFSYKLNWVL